MKATKCEMKYERAGRRSEMREIAKFNVIGNNTKGRYLSLSLAVCYQEKGENYLGDTFGAPSIDGL